MNAVETFEVIAELLILAFMLLLFYGLARKWTGAAVKPKPARRPMSEAERRRRDAAWWMAWFS
jgi:hypothetical protein